MMNDKGLGDHRRPYLPTWEGFKRGKKWEEKHHCGEEVPLSLIMLARDIQSVMK